MREVLGTAFTGFRAAVLESRRAPDGSPIRPCRVAVHTGFWGCGAFGGNRVLMVLLQALAAAMAGLDLLVVHTGAPSGASDVDAARALRDEILAPGTPRETSRLVERIAGQGFTWGVGDRN